MSRLNIDDTDSENNDDSDETIDLSRPWLNEWNAYFNTHDVVPEGMGVVRWWGVCSSYPCSN
jgi:hypothetical protein